jgi:hypothetical protein
MFIIDFQTEKIAEVTEMELCMIVNGLIADKSTDLLGKRYLFVPDRDSAFYLVDKMLKEKKNAIRH